MAQYRFTLSNYHAIQHADIKLDGITVISGCNGCGKSTIARWLYAFVNYANEYANLVDRRLISQINNRLNRMYRIIRSIDNRNLSALRQFKSIRDAKLSDEDLDYDMLVSIFRSKVNLFCDIVDTAISNDPSPSFRKWIKQSLGTEDNLYGDYLTQYHDNMIDTVEKYIDKAIKVKRENRFDDLLRFIREGLDIYSDVPERMTFEENGHQLIYVDEFIPPIGLRNAIYIDTPMALSTRNSSDNRIWDKMMNAMIKPESDITYGARKVAVRIRQIIGGSVIVKEDEFTNDIDIRYVRKQDNLDISIDEAATGLKSFAYILRLIENGNLNQDSMLLIDEPEAHLHPQWIVEFARVLVLLQKEVGTKILIASHNPDMVAALHSISKAHGLEDRTSFYQAYAEESSMKFTYKYLGNDIEPIFRSFNIALERIKDYGS